MHLALLTAETVSRTLLLQPSIALKSMDCDALDPCRCLSPGGSEQGRLWMCLLRTPEVGCCVWLHILKALDGSSVGRARFCKPHGCRFKFQGKDMFASVGEGFFLAILDDSTPLGSLDND